MDLAMSRDDLTEFMAQEFPEVGGDIVVESVQPFEVTVRMKTDHRHIRPGGTVSGPTIFTLADTSIYLAVLTMIGPRALAVTTSCAIDFIRKPAANRDLIAHARINKLGRVLAVGQVLVYSDGADKPVAQASLTYSIPPKK